MQNIKKNWGLLLLAITGLFALAPESLLAQATPESVLTSEASSLITTGTAVGIAALGIFAALLVFRVVKRFFMAGK